MSTKRCFSNGMEFAVLTETGVVDQQIDFDPFSLVNAKIFSSAFESAKSAGNTSVLIL